MDRAAKARVSISATDLFDASASGMLLLEIETNVVVATNPAFSEITGIAPETAHDRPIQVIGLWADPRQYEAFIASIRQNGCVQNFRARIAAPSGPEQMLVSGRRVNDEQALLLCEFQSLHGLSDFAAQTRELLQTRNTILDCAAFGILFVRDRKIIWANRSFASMLGYHFADIVGQDTLFFYPDTESYRLLGQEAYAALGSGQAYSKELQLRHHDGSLVWVRLTGNAIDPDAPRHGSIWIFENIDQRKISESRLQASESRLRALFESTSDAIYIKDMNGAYLLANSAVAQFVGKPIEEILGKDDRTLFPPEDAEMIMARDRDALRAESAVTYEDIATTADGVQRVFFSTKGPLRDDNGNITGLFGVSRDITARRDAEIRQMMREEQIRSISNNLHDGYLFQINLTPSGKQRQFIFLSDGAEAIHGFSIAEMLMDPRLIYGQVLQEDSENFLEAEAEAVNTMTPLMADVRIRRDWGEIRWLSIRATPCALPDGQKILDGIVLDVTESREARLAQQRVEEQYSALFQQMLIGFTLNEVLYGANAQPIDLKIIDINPAFEELTGCPADALIGRRLSEVSRFADCFWAANFENAVRTNKPVLQEHYCVKSSRHLLVHGFIAAPGQYATIILDISERKFAQQEASLSKQALQLVNDCNLSLSRAESEYQLLQEICRLFVENGGYAMAWVGMPMHDPGKSVECLASFGDKTGYLSNLDISWDENLPSGNGPVGRCIRTHEIQIVQVSQAANELKLWNASLQRANFHAIASLPLLYDQELFGVLSFYASEDTGFSEESAIFLKEIASNVAYGIHVQRTRRQRDMAKAASEAKSSFLANMSHEIRTPLNAIIGMATLVRRGGLNATQTEQMNKLERASGHLLEVVSDILDLSKIEANKFTLEEVPVSPTDVLKRVAELVSPRLDSAKVSLEIEAPSLPCHLLGDPTRLQQALLNFAGNAAKFTPAGKIVLRVLVLEDRGDSMLLRFEVSDTGIGISSEAAKRLFQPFEQADNTTSRQFGGTGLGLSITRKLAELMGGQAGLDSSPGVGSTFWFAACLKKCDIKPAVSDQRNSSTAEESLRHQFAGTRLLLVDDEPLNLEIACALLESTGLSISTAANGREAVSQAESGNFELILMDMQMPEMDGLTACREIRRLPQYENRPIIAMTANAYAEDREKCLAAGMNDFLTKPIEPPILFSTLLAWLRRTRVQENTASLNHFLWCETYSVGNATLDQHHKTLLKLCGDIHDLESLQPDARSETQLHDILTKMARYAEYHFRYEEALMTTAAYPELKAHQQSHQTYRDAMVDFIYSAATTRPDPRRLAAYLQKWWLQHILEEDLGYKGHVASLANPPLYP